MKYVSLITLFAVAFAGAAMAGGKPDWVNCFGDISKYQCREAKSDSEIYQCLIKHNDALSKSCAAETLVYEKINGKPGTNAD